MQLILEPRFLFDGSVGAVARPVAHGLHHVFETGGDTHSGHASHSNEPGLHDTVHAGPAYDIPAIAPNPAATTLLFVDPRVTGWQSLAASVSSNVQVIVLNPNRDAIDQVTKALNGRSGITAIDFLAYGTAGAVEIGNTPLTAATVSSHASEIAGWSDHLAANADILFYSCDVAQGATGQALLADLHTLTGAQVAAATDAVGSAALGGTWSLDTSTGYIDASTPFSGVALAAYTGILDSAVPTVTITGPATALPGATFTETVTLTNSAANAAGNAPFIEVFAPANATENASLASAVEGGQALTVTAVTLTADASGHVVAVDPMVRDANGNAQAVAAPAGYQAGDTMYVVQLAPGSIAAGAAQQVALTFALAGSSVPATAGLEIAAIGGFQDAGSTIRGTSVLEGNLATDAGNGLATTNPNVAYVTAEAQVTYETTNSATATTEGLYELTITTAPVVSEHPLNGLNFTVALPSNATYSGGGVVVTGVGAAGAVATVESGGSTGGQSLALDFPTLAAGGTTTILVPLSVAGSQGFGTTSIPALADPSVTYTGRFPSGGDPTNTSTYVADGWSKTSNGGAGYTISLPQFDTSGGNVLTDATITLAGYVYSTGSVTASAGSAATISNYSQTESIYLTKPGALIKAGNALLLVSPVIFSLPDQTVAAGSTYTVGPVNPNAALATTLSGAALTAYEGTGNVSFGLISAGAVNGTFSGGNLVASLTTTALAQATITYDYTVPIVTTATFTAHVYTDTNGLGTGTEPALANVTVELLDSSGHAVTGQANQLTNSSGDVSFSGLAPGSYQIAVVTPGNDVVTQHLDDQRIGGRRIGQRQ